MCLKTSIEIANANLSVKETDNAKNMFSKIKRILNFQTSLTTCIAYGAHHITPYVNKQLGLNTYIVYYNISHHLQRDQQLGLNKDNVFSTYHVTL